MTCRGPALSREEADASVKIGLRQWLLVDLTSFLARFIPDVLHQLLLSTVVARRETELYTNRRHRRAEAERHDVRSSLEAGHVLPEWHDLLSTHGHQQ